MPWSTLSSQVNHLLIPPLTRTCLSLFTGKPTDFIPKIKHAIECLRHAKPRIYNHMPLIYLKTKLNILDGTNTD